MILKCLCKWGMQRSDALSLVVMLFSFIMVVKTRRQAFTDLCFSPLDKYFVKLINESNLTFSLFKT